MNNNKTQVLSTVPDVTAKMIDVAITKIANALIYNDKANELQEVKEVLSKRNEAIHELVLEMNRKRALEVGSPVSKSKSKTTAKPKGMSLTKKKMVQAKQRTEAA